MKKIFFLAAITAMFALSCDKYDDSEIRGLIDDQDGRIEKLEAALANQQKAIDDLKKAAQEMDYVTGITPIKTGDVTTSIIVSFKTAASITIQLSGETKEDLIKDVRTENGYAVFVLNDDTSISIPMATSPVLTIAVAEVVCLPGKSASFQYTVSGGDVNNQIEAIAENGWTAEVVPANAEGGVVNVTAPASGKGKVLVIVNSGAGLCAMKTISCIEGKFTVSDKKFDLSADGGEFTFKVGTNLDENYVITLADGCDWISQVTTKAQYKEDEITFSASANSGKEERSTSITVSASGIDYTISVTQEGRMSYIWVPCESAANLVEGDCIIAYKDAASGGIYVLPTTANGLAGTLKKVDPNPVPALVSGIYTLDASGNITDAEPLYAITAFKNGDNWKFHYFSKSGNEVLLIGLDAAQGVMFNQLSVASMAIVSCTAEWTAVDDATNGFQLKASTFNRYLSATVSTSTWNMAGANAGHMVIYQKTAAE